MSHFSVDYFLLVFVSACGVLQIAAAQSGLRGLMFFACPLRSQISGLLMVVGVFLWFFLSAPRNLPDTGGGLDGNAQTALFAAGAGAALAFTLLLSSLKNFFLGDGNGPYNSGLEALKETNYLRALTSISRDLQALADTLKDPRALVNTLKDLWKRSWR